MFLLLSRDHLSDLNQMEVQIPPIRDTTGGQASGTASKKPLSIAVCPSSSSFHSFISFSYAIVDESAKYRCTKPSRNQNISGKELHTDVSVMRSIDLHAVLK